MTTNTGKSADLSKRARAVMPGGVSHYFRYQQPHPIYIKRAQGAYKWDENDNRYIDYKMGSASQMLGHCPAPVVEAVQRQMTATPYTGDCNRHEVEWAEILCRLYPSINQVRFTSSGTESTMLAIRLGRAFSGKPKLLRISSHYHGWHDHVMKGAKPAVTRVPSLGVPDEVSDLVEVIDADLTRLAQALEDEQIGTVIIEASGANYGAVPLAPGFLQGARELTGPDRVLIFDEVITGFRWAAGGKQSIDNVMPDLTTLAKILTGGLPGGAVGGRRDIMRLLDPGETVKGISPPVLHQGTFNGNHLIAAAAVAGLTELSTGEPQRHADHIAGLLRTGINELMAKHDIAGACYGESSTFHLYFGACEQRSVSGLPAAKIRGTRPELVSCLKRELNARGVDLMSAMSAVTSSAHTQDDVEQTLRAFDSTLKVLKDKGLLPDE